MAGKANLPLSRIVDTVIHWAIDGIRLGFSPYQKWVEDYPFPRCRGHMTKKKGATVDWLTDRQSSIKL